MSTTTELTELHNLISSLRRCVTELRSKYADSPALHRIVLDTERILHDVDLLDSDTEGLDLSRCIAQHSGEKIQVPDTEYDNEFWRDVDDEGVGGQAR